MNIKSSTITKAGVMGLFFVLVMLIVYLIGPVVSIVTCAVVEVFQWLRNWFNRDVSWWVYLVDVVLVLVIAGVIVLALIQPCFGGLREFCFLYP